MKKKLVISLALIALCNCYYISETSSVIAKDHNIAQQTTNYDQNYVVQKLNECSTYSNAVLGALITNKFQEAYNNLQKAYKSINECEQYLQKYKSNPDCARILARIPITKASIYSLQGRIEIEKFNKKQVGISHINKAFTLDSNKTCEMLFKFIVSSKQTNNNSYAQLYTSLIEKSPQVSAEIKEQARSLSKI